MNPHIPSERERGFIAILIWICFIGSILLLLFNGIPKGNEALVAQMMTMMASGAALVVNYYFKRNR